MSNFNRTLKLSKPMNPKRIRPAGMAPARDDRHCLAEVSQIKTWLIKKYPVIAECKPLAIHCHREILKGRDPLWSIKRTRQAVHRLVSRKGYLVAMAEPNSKRFNLDGSEAGVVSDDHRRLAREQLDQKMKNATMTSRGENKSQNDPNPFTSKKEIDHG